MARVNIDILGVRELKWSGMGEFNSDDHYFIIQGSDLGLGTQGRSRRLNEAYILRIRNAEHRTDLYPGAPQRPPQF